MIANENQVPKKQWAKWSQPCRAMFNQLFGKMVKNPFLFNHPKACINEAEWRTVAWNAAWMAADLLRGVDATAERSVAR